MIQIDSHARILLLSYHPSVDLVSQCTIMIQVHSHDPQVHSLAKCTPMIQVDSPACMHPSTLLSLKCSQDFASQSTILIQEQFHAY